MSTDATVYKRVRSQRDGRTARRRFCYTLTALVEHFEEMDGHLVRQGLIWEKVARTCRLPARFHKSVVVSSQYADFVGFCVNLFVGGAWGLI